MCVVSPWTPAICKYIINVYFQMPTKTNFLHYMFSDTREGNKIIILGVQ